jgi:hypothetical protein
MTAHTIIKPTFHHFNLKTAMAGELSPAQAPIELPAKEEIS